MRYLLLVTTLLAFYVTSFCQNNSKEEKSSGIGQTSFIAEGGGPGIAFSANIDRRFSKSRLGFGGRIGIGFVSAYDSYYDPVTGYYYGGKDRSAFTTPVQLNYIFGKGNSAHTLEVGAGLTYVSRKLDIMNFYDEASSQLFGTFCFMYRRQPVNGGFSWRAGFTPIIAKSYIQPFGAVSVGYNF